MKEASKQTTTVIVLETADQIEPLIFRQEQRMPDIIGIPAK